MSARVPWSSSPSRTVGSTSWRVGAYNDVSFGLHKAARYYYYPGWQEPGPGLETIVNKKAWESLPPDLQAILETTCQAITTDMVAEYTHGNAYSLQQLRDDPNVELRKFPQDVLDVLKRFTDEIVAEWVGKDPAAKKIADSYYAFLDKSAYGQAVTEKAYLDTRESA
jgi:TRAP-type mannitol/chloroaromatic compound transport system substrate-binding protein